MNHQEENPTVEVETFEGKVVYEFTAEDDPPPPPSSARREEDGGGKKKKKKKKAKKAKKVKKSKGSTWTWFLAQTLLLSLVSGFGIYYMVFLPSIVPSVTTANAVVTRGGTNSTTVTCSNDKKTCNLFNHASGNVYYMTNPKITRKTDKCLRIAWKDQGMQIELSTCEPGAMRESILKEIPS